MRRVPLLGGGGNLHWNLAHDALAAIGGEHGFNYDFVARADFGYVCAGAFQACPAAFANEIKVELHAVDRGSVVRIVVDASEALAERKRGGHGGGLSVFRGNEHVLQADFGKSLDVDAAIQAVSDFLAVFIHAMQGVEDGRHDRNRAQAWIV